MLPASRKDILPAHQKSSVICEYNRKYCPEAYQKNSVIYEYKCHCDSRYVGTTYQRLQDRIKQHVPKWLRQHTGSQRIQPDQACKKKTIHSRMRFSRWTASIRERPMRCQLQCRPIFHSGHCAKSFSSYFAPSQLHQSTAT